MKKIDIALDMSLLPSIDLFSKDVHEFRACIYFVLSPDDELVFIGAVKSVRRCPPIGLLTSSSPGRIALDVVRSHGAATLRLFYCTKKEVEPIRLYFERKYQPKTPSIKPPLPAPKIRLVSNEVQKVEPFAVSGIISIHRRGGTATVGKWLFHKSDLEKFGFTVKNGTAVNVEVRQSNKASFQVAIIRRLDDDLRTLSDMRTKPAWREQQWLEPTIDAIYAERDRLTTATGIPHEVDHIHPIKHPRLCGLTVPWNLQIISATENRRKSNKLSL